jgi:hypothetical protein
MTAANRTEFVIAFGSVLPGSVELGEYVPPLSWSVEYVAASMDSASLSRAAVVSEIMAVKHAKVQQCVPVDVSDMARAYGPEVPAFLVAHSLGRPQILAWYASVAAIIGTRQIVPIIRCPANALCQRVAFTGGKSVCSVCSKLLYMGSSGARSRVSDFCVCESCCRNPAVLEELGKTELPSPDSGAASPSNAAADLLELLLHPRSMIPSADNFAEDNWHKAFDIWMRLLRDVTPSPSLSHVRRPRHLLSLEDRLSGFRRIVQEPQFHFRVSSMDQANVCEAMKQIFDCRAKINLKLADAQQGSVEHSKLTVLFRNNERAGQAAGMPANIHSDGITPVMYSILALELSNPKKFAAGMWLPSCCIDADVAPCGLFPRPFIPDPSPLEMQLQQDAVSRFLFLGRCIGIALRDRRVFMLPLSLAFADALCGKHLSLWDACLGEINLQEDDGLSANHSVLHAIEHRLDYATSFSMVYRGQTLANQRVDVPISAASFDAANHCCMNDIPAAIAIDSRGVITVNVTRDVLEHARQVCGDGDTMYVSFTGQLPPGLLSSRAYKVFPAAGTPSPQLYLCTCCCCDLPRQGKAGVGAGLDPAQPCCTAVAAASPARALLVDCAVSMHIMRVYSSEDAAGDEYLRALEVRVLLLLPAHSV